ncbi:hypothetical protein [Mycobacterium sp. 48b]|uniref:hypothetical protein n=1 Tax=Mycobacterium sp. 48b TaxID=3400426 RepID=UPI003AAB590C
MAVIDVLVLLLAVLGTALLIGRCIRAKRELSALRAEKIERRRERGVGADDPIDLLFLLSDEEKRALLRKPAVLPKWLGSKNIAELEPYEAAWYAGFARPKMHMQRYLSAIFAVVGGLCVTRYLFPLFDWVLSQTPRDDKHVLPAVGHTFLELAHVLPLMIGFAFIGVSVLLKQRSDDLEFYADALEERSK